MEKKFLTDISANTLQVVINQLSGICIFYILSLFLEKSIFGELNWSLAILLTGFGILALGIDQVFVRRIAAGVDKKSLLSLYVIHVLATGLFFYCLLLLGWWLIPGLFGKHQLLLWLGIGKLALFFSTPFKNLATGMERFRPLLWMSVCSNLLRSIALLALAITGSVNLPIILIVFVAGDFAEMLLALFITHKMLKIPLTLSWNKRNYAGLLTESMPQFGVSIFTSVIARFDWIMLGFFSTTFILAEYSFAYKVFEMASLPLLVIAPILIPRFTRLFHPVNGQVTPEKISDLLGFMRIEMVIASLSGLLLNLLWVPVIDLITLGKYGVVNSQTILVLSACMPFIYLNNFLWTINFANGRMNMIFWVFALTFAVNMSADLVLIPFYGGEGAAFGYLLAMIAQSVAFLSRTKIPGLAGSAPSVLIAPACAFFALFATTHFIRLPWPALAVAIPLFFLFLLLTRQINKGDWQLLKRISSI